MTNAERAALILKDLIVAQSYVVGVLKTPDKLRPEDIKLASLYTKDALAELQKWRVENATL